MLEWNDNSRENWGSTCNRKDGWLTLVLGGLCMLIREYIGLMINLWSAETSFLINCLRLFRLHRYQMLRLSS